MPLSLDPLDEARRQWTNHGWGALEAMSAATAITRANQLVLAGIDRVLRPFGLTFSRYEALVLLTFTRTGSLPLGKMGERLMVHPTSITNTIDRLERQGYVRRVPHPSDRRAVLAEITDDGRAVVKEATDALVSAEFAVPALDDGLVERLADSLRRARQPEAGSPGARAAPGGAGSPAARAAPGGAGSPAARAAPGGAGSPAARAAPGGAGS